VHEIDIDITKSIKIYKFAVDAVLDNNAISYTPFPIYFAQQLYKLSQAHASYRALVSCSDDLLSGKLLVRLSLKRYLIVINMVSFLVSLRFFFLKERYNVALL